MHFSSLVAVVSTCNAHATHRETVHSLISQYTLTLNDSLPLARLTAPALDTRRVFGLRVLALTQLLRSSPWFADPSALNAINDANALCHAVSTVSKMKSFRNPSTTNAHSIAFVDAKLDELALLYQPSSNCANLAKQRRDILQELLQDASPDEAVYIIKVILKMPVTKFHESWVLCTVHPSFWKMFKLQPDLRAVTLAIDQEKRCTSSKVRNTLIEGGYTSQQQRERPSQEKSNSIPIIDLCSGAQIQLGVNIANMSLSKATSCRHVIKHMATRLQENHFVAEVKYDGERNQIHYVRPNASVLQSTIPNQYNNGITLFSKSKRNSTCDRKLCHEIVLAALGVTDEITRIGGKLLTPVLDPSIEYVTVESAVLDSEILVYNEDTHDFEAFHEARIFASESARNLDPAIREGRKHYKLVFFDIMYLNGVSLLNTSYIRRREILATVIRRIPNFTDISRVKHFYLNNVDSSYHRDSDNDQGDDACCIQLQKYFLQVCAEPAEGLVFKGASGLYEPGREHLWMKLKKDYIEGFGDTADFCVIGGSYRYDLTEFLGVTQSHDAELLNCFYVGCQVNRGSNETPALIQLFDFSAGFSRESLVYFSKSTLTFRHKSASTLRSYKIIQDIPDLYSNNTSETAIRDGMKHPKSSAYLNSRIDYYFDPPIAVELKGGGFECRAGKWALRGPRYLRTCGPDRSWLDTITFQEFAEMGRKANEPTAWETDLAKLAAADFKEKSKRVNVRRTKRIGIQPLQVECRNSSPLLGSFRGLSCTLSTISKEQLPPKYIKTGHQLHWRNPDISKIPAGELEMALIHIPQCNSRYTEAEANLHIKQITGIKINVIGRIVHSIDALIACTGWQEAVGGHEGNNRPGILLVKDARERDIYVKYLEIECVVSEASSPTYLVVVAEKKV